MDVKEEAILGSDIDGHWYYVAKGRAMRAFLGNQEFDEVLDVGAGSGVFSRQLLDGGLARRATCVDTGYQVEREEKHNGREIRFLREIKAVSQTLILMMDVLEHVDDDVGLLRAYTSDMPRDGRVLISVPAFEFLWSSHDVFLEHHRRYTLLRIEQTIQQAGLQVLKSRFFFGTLFPIAAAVRIGERIRLGGSEVEARSHLKRSSRPVNDLLVALHDLERMTLFHFNKLAGLTVFCLAKPS